MNLTTKGRYAVMAMVDLAMHGKGSPITLAEIAERQDITLNYLEQIFMKLRKSGLVQSVRGPGGGYVLASQVEAISIAQIVLAVDESINMTRCNIHAGGEGCLKKNAKCITHNLWEGLTRQIYNYLHSVSLADVCSKKNTFPDEEIMAHQADRVAVTG